MIQQLYHLLIVDQNQFKDPGKSKYLTVILYLSLSLADIHIILKFYLYQKNHPIQNLHILMTLS
jgi:hypothetical protein